MQEKRVSFKGMKSGLLVLETHPVQYRVPLWRRINELSPDSIHVAYISDKSVSGYFDKCFGRFIRWDTPLLFGYPSTVLLPQGKSRGRLYINEFIKLVRKCQPRAILFTSINSFREFLALLFSLCGGIPVWLRTETQNEAFRRTPFKTFVRRIIYTLLYRRIEKFFSIGNLNLRHLKGYGVPTHKIIRAPYATPDPSAGLADSEKWVMRNKTRNELGISCEMLVVGFAGKLIEKKNPAILFHMLAGLDPNIRNFLFLYFIGSGRLDLSLRTLAEKAFNDFGVRSYFAGFVNQSHLASHYCAIDIFVLPSKRMGETWGLVVNEALQCGCSAIVSSAVGCGDDFKSLDRFRVFDEQDAFDLARQITSLAKHKRDFEWARKDMTFYSIDRAALAITKALNTFSR